MKVISAFVLSVLISHTQSRAVCDSNAAMQCFNRRFIDYAKASANSSGRREDCNNWNSILQLDCFKNCPRVNLKDAIGEKVSKNLTQSGIYYVGLD